MQIPPVCGQLAVGPSVWVGAVKAKRVAIVAVDIDLRGPVGARSKVSLRRSVVVDVGDDNASVAELLLDNGPVALVGELNAIDSARVLVLRLEEDDRAAVGDLGLGDDLTNVLDVAGGSVSFAPRALDRATYLSVALMKASSSVLSVPLTRWSQPGKPPPETSALM